MKRITILCAGLLLAGCASERPSKPDVRFEQTADASCYTVDLFTAPKYVRPAGEVPDAWRGFTGEWGGGAWDGVWCHDLYILEVKPDGLVRLIETHAPNEAWGKRATAFQRTARIDGDDRLRLTYGRVKVEYWLQDGRLYGLRDEDGVKRRIMLSRKQA